MALSDTKVRALKPRDKLYKVSDDRGLYLEVRPNGSRLWRYRYRLHDKDKRIALGAYPTVGLADARQKRDDAQRQVAQGIDPVVIRRRQKLTAAVSAANSFGDVAKEYIEKVTKEGRAEATIEKAHWLLKQLSPLARLPIADIKPLEVLAALKKLEKKGNHETARRCRSFASRVFRYGVATGRGESDPSAILRGALVVPRTTHHAALIEPHDVGMLLRAIDGYEGYPVTQLACKIAPHVMLRPGELRHSVWSDIDWEKEVWSIPPERMKMRRPHSVPLSRQVLAYLKELADLTGPDGYLFPAFHSFRKPMCENTVNQAFRRMGFTTRQVTAHGLRTTASTLLNESGKWSPDAIERSLAHADANLIRATYNRGPVDIELEGRLEPVDDGAANAGSDGSASCLLMEVGGAVTARAHHMIEWILLPFVPPVDRARAAAFEAAIRTALNLSPAQDIGARLLQERLQTAEGRLLLRSCYETIIVGGAGASHNRISMSLYSGPLPADRPLWQHRTAWPWPAHPFGWTMESGSRVGWIAAGDAKLNGDEARRQWLDFYRQVRTEVGTFLLPHHGSRHNFHADLLGPMSVRWGIAAADPREEGYHHPSLSVVEALRRTGCRLMHVTKDPMTLFEEHIRPIDR